VAQDDNKVGPPRLPKGKVLQTISRSEYVDNDKLDARTKIGNRNMPDGLTLICHLYAEAEQGGPAHHSQESCALPEGAKLDTSFRQQAFLTPCSGGGATTNLTVADVPQGFYISCDGGYYWAVLAPLHILALEFDNNGSVLQWGISVGDLYCGPGGGTHGGCNVKLDIYAKIKH